MTQRQLDLLSAALRHVRDAEHLLEAGSHHSTDQAWHLAGLGPECVRKACIVDTMLDMALGHDLSDNAEPLLEWGLSLDPRASRYHLEGWPKAAPLLSTWTPVHRYERTGSRNDLDGSVSGLVGSARALVERVHADLWSDGCITGREP